jgi:alkaline phosphatase
LRFPLRFLFFLLFLFSSLNAQDQKPVNIIILIGDGMGVNTVGTSILSDPESPFNEFHSIGFSVTTALDNLITDSAAGATAISTGHKTKNGYIAISSSGEKLKTIFEEAEERGISTGIVVTSSVTHATPAAFYAHNISRDNEYEIAGELISSGIDAAIGAGTKFFKQWQNDKDKFLSAGYEVFTDAKTLLEKNNKNKFIALLEPEAFKRADRRDYNLSQLVQKALDVLAVNEKGFILMIEGSQIDWAAHENDTPYLIAEMNDFTGAVKTSLRFAESNPNTLVIVTADHETGGVAVVDGNKKGERLKLEYSSIYHTAGLVPVFAKGPGEENFRGVYENNIIGQKLFELIRTSKK